MKAIGKRHRIAELWNRFFERTPLVLGPVSTLEPFEIGYDVTLFFIIGLPGETVNEVEESFRFAQKYPVFDAKFYNLIPFPKTDIYRWLEKHN